MPHHLLNCVCPKCSVKNPAARALGSLGGMKTKMSGKVNYSEMGKKGMANRWAGHTRITK